MTDMNRQRVTNPAVSSDAPGKQWSAVVGLILLVVVVAFNGITFAQSDTANTETTGDNVPNVKVKDSTLYPWYLSYSAGIFASDGVYRGNLFSINLGIGLVSDWVYVEHRISPISLIYIKERGEKLTLSSTPIVWMAIFNIPLVIGEVFSVSQETTMKYILPVFLIPFGYNLLLQPDPRLSIYGGYSIDYLLFSPHDGVLIQPRLGIRYRFEDSRWGLALEGGKSRFWSWEKESRTYDWGIGLILSYDVVNTATNKEFEGYRRQEPD